MRRSVVVGTLLMLGACSSPSVEPNVQVDEARELAAEVDRLIAAGELVKADELAERVIALDPISPSSNMTAARAKSALAERDGRPLLYHEAIGFADAAIDSAPDNARYRQERALLQYQRRYFTAALADLDHVLQLEPANVEARRLAARCHRALRQPIAERGAWQDLLRYAPDDVEAHRELGSRLIVEDADADPAAVAAEQRQHLQRAADLAQDDPLTQHALADLLLAQGDLPGAESAYKRAVFAAQSQPTRQSDALFNLGAVVQSQGRFAEAADYYRRAAEYTPDDPRVLANYGYVLVQLGRTAEATEQLERAQQLEQDNSRRRRIDDLLDGVKPATEGSE